MDGEKCRYESGERRDSENNRKERWRKKKRRKDGDEYYKEGRRNGVKKEGNEYWLCEEEDKYRKKIEDLGRKNDEDEGED